MGPYQRIMLLRGIKQIKAQQPLMEIKHLDPWLGNHQAKFNQVETLLKVPRIKTIRFQKSRIVKEIIKKREKEKMPNLNSLTFISLVKVAQKSSKDKALKMTLKMVSMIQKRSYIKKTKRDRIILKQELQINMKTFRIKREVLNKPLQINNNKF